MKDMTKGSPWKVIVAFAIPMVISSLLQQCYNIADSMIAGRFAGTQALAAIGVSTPITQLFVNLGTGAGMGCSVVISQIFGSKDMKKLKTSIYTALIAFFILSLILMSAGSIFSPGLARLLNTPEDIFEDALVYLRIYMFGLPFLFLYNAANSVFNALGDSKKPLYFLIFSTALNIALDILFVKEFNWGVKGVAWATFIAQGMAALLANVVLLLKTQKLEKKVSFFSTELLGGMSKVGIPTMIQSAIINIGNLFVSALVNSKGSEFIAGYSAAVKINGFLIVMVVTLGGAVGTFTAQNIGAKQMDRPGQGLKVALIINTIYVAIASLVIFLFGHGLVGLFLDASASETVYQAGILYLRYVTVGMFTFVFLNNCCAVCRGAGYMIAFTSTTLIDLIIRVASAYILDPIIGDASVSVSVVIGWCVGAVMGICFYLGGKWKNVKLLKND